MGWPEETSGLNTKNKYGLNNPGKRILRVKKKATWEGDRSRPDLRAQKNPSGGEFLPDITKKRQESGEEKTIPSQTRDRAFCNQQGQREKGGGKKG